MRNLQALRNKVASQVKLIVTPFADGTVVEELNGGWKKIQLQQVTIKRSNLGTAVNSYRSRRNAFVNIAPLDFELYGEYLVAGADYNEILDAVGETPKMIVNQLSTQKFYESQSTYKGKDKDGNLIELATKDGEPYYNRGILAELGAKDIWGSNDPHPETGYPVFKAFDEVVETEAVAETAEVGELA